MADAPTKKKGCWKAGCIGCAGLLLLGIGIPLIVMVVGLSLGRPDPTPGSESRSTELPALPGATAESETPSNEGDTGGDASLDDASLDAAEGPLMPEAVVVPDVVPATGTLELDVELCRFKLIPGPPGSELRVEADFDTAGFELDEDYSARPDGSWAYRLSFQDKLGWLRRIGTSNAGTPLVRLFVPQGRPFVLSGKVGTGESAIELGGLWPTSVDLDLGVGEHRLKFSQPTTQPIDVLRVGASVGDLQILRAGNASPEEIHVTTSVGGARVDLSGDWQRDAAVNVNCSVGECGIVVPSHVFVDVAEANLTMAGERRMSGLDRETMPEEGAPTLTLKLNSKVGELIIQTSEDEEGDSPLFPEIRREEAERQKAAEQEEASAEGEDESDEDEGGEVEEQEQEPDSAP